MFKTAFENLNKFFQNIEIKKEDYSFEEAVITMFVYEKFTKENLAILDTFILSHEKYNNNAMLFIFTNLDISQLKSSHNAKIIYLPFSKFKIMTYKVLFNYHIILKFYEFKKTYIFDTDLIAIKNYNHISDKSFDIGVTIANNWIHRKKFPVNAGFLLINNNSRKKIENFANLYLSSYADVIKNKEIINKNTKLKHTKIDLEDWWGDQYLFFYLLDKFPNNISDSSLYEYKGIKYSFFNEDHYNFASLDLKYANANFNFSNYFHIIQKNTYFLHLKGGRKKFIKHLNSHLIYNNK